MNTFRSVSLICILFVSSFLFASARDTAGENNTIVLDNERFVTKLIKKNIKYINEQLSVQSDVKSFKWTYLKWINNDIDECEITGEITYKDSCGLVTVKVEITLVGKGGKVEKHNGGNQMKEQANTKLDDITSHNLKSVRVYMQRCENLQRVPNDYNLERFDVSTDKGGKLTRTDIR